MYKETPKNIDKITNSIRFNERMQKSARHWTLSLAVSTGVAAASIPVMQKSAMYYLVGSEITNKESLQKNIKEVELKLRKLRKTKEGKSPTQLFTNWLKRASKNPKEWLKSGNEPILKANLKTLHAQEAMTDSLQNILNRVIFFFSTMIAAFAIAPTVFKKTQKILERRSELQHKHVIADTLTQIDSRIENLENLSAKLLTVHADTFAYMTKLKNIISKITIGIQPTDEELSEIGSAFTESLALKKAYTDWEKMMRSVSAEIDTASKSE